MIDMIPVMFCILLAILLVALAFLRFTTMQDNKKELMTRQVKVLEKPLHQGNIEWYVVECENGERMKLRSFQANVIIIAIGDVGTVTYKGQTIQTFQRTL